MIVLMAIILQIFLEELFYSRVIGCLCVVNTFENYNSCKITDLSIQEKFTIVCHEFVFSHFSPIFPLDPSLKNEKFVPMQQPRYYLLVHSQQ